jgi:hypothetical protein
MKILLKKMHYNVTTCITIFGIKGGKRGISKFEHLNFLSNIVIFIGY